MVFWKKEPLGGTRLCLGRLPVLPSLLAFPPFLPGNHKVKEVYGPSSSITHPHAMTCTEWDLWNFPHKTTAFNYSVSNYIIDRENLQRNNRVPSLSCLRSISRGSAESHLLCLFPKSLGCCPIKLLGCECLGQRRRNSKWTGSKRRVWGTDGGLGNGRSGWIFPTGLFQLTQPLKSG